MCVCRSILLDKEVLKPNRYIWGPVWDRFAETTTDQDPRTHDERTPLLFDSQQRTSSARCLDSKLCRWS